MGFHADSAMDWSARAGSPSRCSARRWSQPVISAPFADSAHCANTYGIGTPSTYNIDGHSSVRLFFEDYCNFELSPTATPSAAPSAMSDGK